MTLVKLRLETFSYRFADQVLNSRLDVKQEIENILREPVDLSLLGRPTFNTLLNDRFCGQGWEPQPLVFDNPEDPAARMDFLKGRVGIEVGFGHPSFIGIDLLKFQIASYSGLDRIDVGIYIVTTRSFQNRMVKDYNQNWKGSLSFERVKTYLPYLRSAIQIPVYVIGLDI